MSTLALQLSDQDVARIAAAVAAELRKQPQDQLLTPRRAAAVVGLSEKALERRRSRAQAPDFVRKGGRIFYLRSVLDAYVGKSEPS